MYIMNILKEHTRSICPTCFQVVPAQVYEHEGEVYMNKHCPQHGKFIFLIEKDAWTYKKLMNKDILEHRRPFNNVMIAITHACNLKCPVCYLPNRRIPDLSLEDIKEIIANFDGDKIRISGGEPTLREDLPQIIRFTCEQGKIPLLITNGIKLADRNYLRKIKKAGLRNVCFSFNGFNDEAYKKLNGCSLLKIKLKALNNLRRENMNVRLSVMLERGINDKELEKIYQFCIQNNHFIDVLRVRRVVSIDSHDYNIHKKFLYLSEMIDMFSGIIGVKKEELVEHSLSFTSSYIGAYHLPCSLNINLVDLLLKNSGINKINNSVLRKFKFITVLALKIGLRNALGMLIRKLIYKKPALKLNIFIRQCAYKYSMDLEEMKRCPSAHFVGETKEIVPLCYGITLNEKIFL